MATWLDESFMKNLIENTDLDKYEILSNFTVKHMTLDEFLIEYATSEEFGNRFKRYCEILILNDGSIMLPIACGHEQMLRISTGKTKSEVDDKLTPYEIEWYHELLLDITGSCLVWREFQHLGFNHMDNAKVKETLEALERLGILTINIKPKRYLSEEEWVKGVTLA